MRSRIRHTLQVMMLVALFATSPEIPQPLMAPTACVVLLTDVPRPALRWRKRRHSLNVAARY